MERPGPSNDRATPPARSLNAPALWALSILVGVVAGLGAVAFRALIGLVHNLLFLGKLSSAYDANTHTPPSPWGPFVIFVPVAGALGVAFLVKNFAPEAKGHGVPEVMDAVYHRKGIIRPVVSVVKALASALSIGSGASIGREGPIIQIGSSFGSTLGQLLGLPAWQRITLIAAGAGGGIGATFNTPVGGVLFAVEIILHEVSARTLVPVFTATATATYVGELFFGPHPSFSIPALETPFFVVAKPVLLARIRRSGRDRRPGFSAFHPVHLWMRGVFREARQGRILCAAHGGNVGGRFAHVRHDAPLRPLLHARGWIRHHPGRAQRPALPAVPAPSAVCRQAAGDLAYARFGRFWWRVLPRVVLGGDFRGRLGRGSKPLLSRSSD